MLAVTESISLGLTDALFPNPEGHPSFMSAIEDATSRPNAAWFPSGRSAIQAALLDAGIERSDEVLIPGYTCHAVNRAVSSVGTPTYVDIKPDATLDLNDARFRLTENTRAILPTHLFGIECDMKAVETFADTHGLVVLEDAAQAFVNLLTSEQIGNHADYTAFSFRFYKEVTAFTGGLLLGPVTKRESSGSIGRLRRQKLAIVWIMDRFMKSLPGRVYQPLREHLLDPLARSNVTSPDYNSPKDIDEWSRKVLSIQLQDIEQRLETRKRNAAIYDKKLPSTLKRLGQNQPTSLLRYPVRVPDGIRDQLLRRARQRGIGCSPMYAYTISPKGQCPNADRLAAEILHLPVHDQLDPSEISDIAQLINELWQQLG